MKNKMEHSTNSATASRGAKRDFGQKRQGVRQVSRLENFLIGTDAGTWEWHLDNNALVVNDRWLTLLGYDRDRFRHVTADDWRALVHPDDIGTANRRLAEHIDGASPYYEVEFRMRHRAGHWVWILARGKIVRLDDDGRPWIFAGTHLDISSLKQAEAERHAEQAKFHALLKSLNDAVFLCPIETTGFGHFLEVNDIACRHYGYRRDELLRLGPADLRDPDVHYSLCAPEHFQKLLEGEALLYETRHRTRDGVSFPVEVSARVFEFNGTRALMALVRDISMRKRNQVRLLQSAAMFDSSHDGIVITDKEARIISVNPAFERITGYRHEEVIGKNPRFLKSDRNPPGLYGAMWRDLARAGLWRGEIWNRRKDGEPVLEWQTIAAVRDENGQVSGYVGNFSDITEAKKSQEQLRYLSRHDPMTGLPNRRQLEEYLAAAMAGPGRVAVHCVNIDALSNINDSFGHASGDAVIVECARRFQRIVPAAGFLAHFSGDEFVIVTPAPDQAVADDFARMILDVMRAPVAVDGTSINVTVTTGAAIAPECDGDAGTLLRHAHHALHLSKRMARNSHTLYSPGTPNLSRRKVLLQSRLQGALDNQEFVACYQPQVEMATGEIIGYEALLRWRPPGEAEIPPGEFITVAEESGQILAIGVWMLRRACEQVMAHRGGRAEPRRIAVNLSGRQLIERDIVQTVALVLADTGLPPHCLELEVTETFLVENLDQAKAALSGFRQLGVRVSIDDFGTGQSSLGRLRELPVDKLKIDRSFIRGITDNDNDAAIARAVIALARNLGMEVLAEGVETREQRDFLLNEGCTIGQGFLFSPARDAEHILGVRYIDEIAPAL